MNSLLKIGFCCVLLWSCQSKQVKKVNITEEIPSHFEMYKTSEMAELMRTMLSANKEIRKQIIEGENIGNFDEDFLKIHTATLTNSAAFDESYPVFADNFLVFQKAIFTVEKSERKKQYNNMVNACVACHKDRCTGPIPRIQKLLIQ